MIAFAAVPLATFAAQDESQRQVTQRLQEQKNQLAAIEKAQGAERDKLMQAHMKMMQDTMGKMQAMKPREGMTPTEQKEWMTEHQKLMDADDGSDDDRTYVIDEGNADAGNADAGNAKEVIRGPAGEAQMKERSLSGKRSGHA